MPITRDDVLHVAKLAELDLNREQTLSEIPMFAGLDAVGLWQVASVATEVTLDAGHVLLQPGQEGAGLFVILEGTAKRVCDEASRHAIA